MAKTLTWKMITTYRMPYKIFVKELTNSGENLYTFPTAPKVLDKKFRFHRKNNYIYIYILFIYIKNLIFQC